MCLTKPVIEFSYVLHWNTATYVVYFRISNDIIKNPDE